jgi:signal transduction histidine kinase/ligand-binding sensor domain-containing protein
MSMAFAPDGRLWVGTQDGAAWYDGRDWTTLDMPGREISNYVEGVCPRKDGSICFGRQDGGIAVWSNGAWTRYGQEDGLPLERVNAIAETFAVDGKPSLWAGTFGGGLLRLEGGRWVRWAGKGEVPDRIWRLIPSRQHPGALWVCGDHGITLVDGDRTWSLPGLPAVSVNAILESRDDQGREDLWITTFGKGMARFYEGKLTFLLRKDGMPSDLCTDVAETRSLAGGRVIWFATVAGLVRWDAGRLQTFDTRWGLPTDTVYRLLADPFRGDGLWVGTHGAGIVYFREGGWVRHDALSGLPGNIVLALAPGLPDPQGRSSVLAGTHLGVARWKEGRWTTIAIPSQLQANRINALAEIRGEAGKPVLWVGSLTGLGRLESGRWKVFDAKAGLPHSQVVSLLAIPGTKEEIWVGTQGGGLAHYVQGAWTIHGAAQGLPSNVVLSLACSPDPHGGFIVWVGMKGGGLARYRKGQWRYWNRAQGFSNNVVSGLSYAEGVHGPRLWIGTQGRGVLYTDPRDEDPIFHSMDDQLDESLPSRLIYQIGEDRAGRVYAATPQGVLRLVSQGVNHFRLEQFTEADGLPSSQCTASMTVDQQGHLWVGTILGAGELDTTLPDGKEEPRPLGVTLLNSDHREVPATTLALRGSSRSATFLGTLLATPRPDRIHLRSQLEGLEANPSAWSRERSREFLNIPAGRYAFLLWVRDDRGVVLGPLRREIEIPPAIWETWPFRILLLLLLGAALFGIIRWRMGAVTRHNAELGMLVDQRTFALGETNLQLKREVEDRTRAEAVKDEFLAVVSHELRTPLTAIRGALGLLHHAFRDQATSQEAELITLADRNSRRLLALVNDLLDIQKFEAGHLTLEVQAMDLGESAKRALESYSGLSLTYRCSFLLDVQEGPAPIQADPVRLEQVFANLLSNAAKFSPEESAVRVSITRSDSHVRASVTNQGPPIPEAFRSRIFQKFAQADGSSTRAAGGTGLGLAIAKALVEAHDGTIGFISDETATTFWFELPRAEA